MDIDATVEIETPLTTREKQIFGLMAEGMSRKQIADRLCRSARTVDRHIDHILEKIEAANATHAVSIGVARGWLRLMIKNTLCLALAVSMSQFDDEAMRVRVRTRIRTRETICASRMM